MNANTQSLVVGFVLTTVLGGLLGAALQRAQWNRQARLDIAKKNFSDATALLEEILDLTDRRYYHLYRWFSSVRDGVAESGIAEGERLYYEVVHGWTERLRSHHQGLRRHVGVSYALDFLNYQDDLDPDHPTSLHYRFVLCTRLVREVSADVRVADRAWSEIERLNWHLTEFAQESTTALMKRSESLRQLTTAEVGGDVPALTSRPQPQHPSRTPLA